MATTSLISLVSLLDKVKNMVISDHIQKEVRKSTNLNPHTNMEVEKEEHEDVCVELKKHTTVSLH